MKKSILIVILFTSSLVSLFAHDIHVSVCDIRLNNKTIDITIKTFLDDLQIAMGLVPGEQLPNNYSSAEEMIGKYLMDQMKLSIDGINLPLVPSEIDASNDAVWITIRIENVDIESGQEITWKSTFLNEIYDDQTNIVNIKKDDKKEVFALSRKKTFLTHQL